MESINVACVLQEVGNAESRACTRSQVYVEYFIIPYTSTLIRLSQLYQEFYVHYIIINDWKYDRWTGGVGGGGGGMLALYQGFGWGAGGGVS